jgi:uncharacterized protein YciI
VSAAVYVVLLRFAEHRGATSQHMQAHNAWIAEGFADGVFVLVGSLQPSQGGAIVARATTLEDLQRRVDRDPFVVAGVVTAEILAITPSRTDPRLDLLLG